MLSNRGANPTVAAPTEAVAEIPVGLTASLPVSEMVTVTVPTPPSATRLFVGVIPGTSLNPTGLYPYCIDRCSVSSGANKIVFYYAAIHIV